MDEAAHVISAFRWWRELLVSYVLFLRVSGFGGNGR
jgi:hypothetical protein